ncbi:MAG: MBL fold metallo-hydrolase [Alphaproteobacteria bacterium]|nr:MBL fold metallo-hydrolase [Alphaproteobacteria bacterium]
MKIKMALAGVLATVLAACSSDGTPASGTAQAQEGPTRAITQIAGDLYRFQNNRHYSVFLVTPDGIIATDPINEEAATWLKAELDKRFGVPVKYVIYSHHHGDHASGGAVFADTATFIGHQNMIPALAGSAGSVHPPDETFENRMTVELGGKSVELHYLGRNHSADMTVMLFAQERAVFAVDFVTVARLPFRDLRGGFLPDWINAIKALEALDFDILAPGHGPLGGRADAAEHRLYFEELTAAVAQGIADGVSLEELQETVRMEKYAAWGQYNEWRADNISGVYRILSAGGM